MAARRGLGQARLAEHNELEPARWPALRTNPARPRCISLRIGHGTFEPGHHRGIVRIQDILWHSERDVVIDHVEAEMVDDELDIPVQPCPSHLRLVPPVVKSKNQTWHGCPSMVVGIIVARVRRIGPQGGYGDNQD